MSHQFFCPLYPYTTHRKKDSLYIMSVLRFYSHNRSHHQVGAYIDAVILHLHWNQAFMMLKRTEGNILSEIFCCSPGIGIFCGRANWTRTI